MRASLEVESYTISWIRVYPSALRPADVLGRPVATTYGIGEPGPEWAPGDSAFFDIQTVRRRHVACARVTGLEMTLELGSGRSSLTAPVAVHLLLHNTGLIVYRLTLTADGVTGSLPASVADFDMFHECMWRGRKASWTYPSDDAAQRMTGDVRALMDRLFFTAHAWTRDGRRPSPSDLDLWTNDTTARYDRLEGLAREDELLTGYPVSFGTHYELSNADPGQAEQLALAGSLGSTAPNVVADGSACHWFLTENKSVLVTGSESRPGDGSDAIDHGRTTLLGYLTLRRAALRSVQRATQRVITEGEHVDRLRVAGWERLIAGLSDEYVLHDDVGAIYEPLKRHLRESDALRDLSALESQVRTNVDSFGSQLDAASDRAGVFLGILFGVVAATSLAPLAQHLAALFLGLPRTQDSFVEGHLGLAAVLDVGLVVVVLAVAYALYRSITRSPFGRRRGL